MNFSLAGGAAGEIAAVGNGDPQDISSTQSRGGQASRLTWRGQALVVLRPAGAKPGTVTLRAAAEGLPDSEVTVVTAPPNGVQMA